MTNTLRVRLAAFLVWTVLANVVGVTARRVVRAPKRPSWTWKHGVLFAVLKDLGAFVRKELPSDQRVIWEMIGSQSSKSARACRLETSMIGGVRVETIAPPETADKDRVLLFFHGGSYCFGSPGTGRALASRLALDAGIRVIVVDYRLAPEHVFPAAVDDAVSVYEALLAQGENPKKVMVAGLSAGGGLSLAFLLACKVRGLADVGAAVAMCPWVDMAATGGSLVGNAEVDWMTREEIAAWAAGYLQGVDPRTPTASPLHGELSGLPDLFIQYGTAELLFDQCSQFVQRARAAGVTVVANVCEDMPHNWQDLAGLIPQSDAAIAAVTTFINEQGRRPAAGQQLER